MFSDSDDFVNRFMAHFGMEHCYVCEINGEIAAMAFMLPTSLSYNVQKFKDLKIQKIKNISLKSQISNLKSLHYVYACATRPQYRRQGIMAKLLETIYEEACRENAAGIFLRAANHNLENYYRSLGFEDFFYRNSVFFKHSARGDHKEGTEIQLITPKVYYEKRLQRLEGFCFVNWGEGFFNFLYETGMQFFEYENAIFSLRIENETIIVDELLGNPPKEEIASLIFNYFSDYKTVKIYYPEQISCCGQVKWCKFFNENPEKGYFAFAME